MEMDDRAWNMLVPEEQTALSLQHGFNKSTWEAGEIMGKAHYKFLEIKQRAEKFIILFTEHFTRYSQVVPIKTDPDFKRYLELTIGERKSVKEATQLMDTRIYTKPKRRDQLISLEILKLKSSTNKDNQIFLAFITEFDRWNNFRILPKQFQEPSAYKRREKNKYKRNIKSLVGLNTLIVKKIEQLYYSEDEINYYLPLVYNNYENHKIIPVPRTPYYLSRLSNSGLYVFPDEVEASNYVELIKSYNLLESKNCKLGQGFWPKFREQIQKAINFRDVENISPIKLTLDYFMGSPA